MSNDREFYLRRASQETQAAIDAVGMPARCAHLDLADRYLDLALGGSRDSAVFGGPWRDPTPWQSPTGAEDASHAPAMFSASPMPANGLASR